MDQMKKTGVQEAKSSPSGRSDFRRLLDQNKIYNLIHYSIAICTQSKSGFSTNYCSIVVLGIVHKDGSFLVIKAWMRGEEMIEIKWKWFDNSWLQFKMTMFPNWEENEM